MGIIDRLPVSTDSAVQEQFPRGEVQEAGARAWRWPQACGCGVGEGWEILETGGSFHLPSGSWMQLLPIRCRFNTSHSFI